jgi:ribosomal protein L6P/L9E
LSLLIKNKYTMIQIFKRSVIKIPKNITIFYCNSRKLLTVYNTFEKKSLNLKTKILVNNQKQKLQVTKIPLFKISNNKKKTLKALQKTYISLIKQIILELSVLVLNKLKLIGVGYRGNIIEIFKTKLIQLKLGYSHDIYIKIPDKLKVIFFKSTNFFISGNSYHLVNQTAALIRSQKTPEIYKGKGILYENEKILIKEKKKN